MVSALMPPNAEVRRLGPADVPAALSLFSELSASGIPPDSQDVEAVLAHPGASMFALATEDGLVAMATLYLLPNVTWGGRPYGVLENVVTAEAHRGRGHARTVVLRCLEEAWRANAIKVMVQTGTRRQAAGFYEACGFLARGRVGLQITAPDI